MVVSIKKIVLNILFVIISIIFNIQEIDSNSDKLLIYDKYNENMEYYTIYFKNINSFELKDLIRDTKIEVIYYIVDNKKYYVRNTDILYEKYTKDMSLENKILYEINGIKVDGIRVFSKIDTLEKIDDLVDIY